MERSRVIDWGINKRTDSNPNRNPNARVPFFILQRKAVKKGKKVIIKECPIKIYYVLPY